jgi:hypothetical protein
VVLDRTQQWIWGILTKVKSNSLYRRS